MTDTWDYLYPNNLGLTFPTDKPVKRIDFIFFRGPLKPVKAVIGGVTEPYNEMASDHLPLIATFVLE